MMKLYARTICLIRGHLWYDLNWTTVQAYCYRCRKFR